VTVAGTCIAAHRVDPARLRPALGGLLLCAGHFDALTETLTGPSAADDPTLDAVWGVRTWVGVIICGPRTDAVGVLALRTASCDREHDPRRRVEPGTLACGDGETWHTPRDYRPGALARDYLTLGTLLTGHVTTAAAHVSGTPDWRLPIADHVAEARTRIRHVLASWARLHAEELPSTPPSGDHPTVTSAWLARYTDWSAAQPWVDEYLAELTELRGRARALIDLPQPRRVDVAACVEYPGGVRCTGQLSTRLREDGDPQPSVIECDTCDAAYTSERWQRLGERIKASVARAQNRRAA
jgi:hypothetical protein